MSLSLSFEFLWCCSLNIIVELGCILYDFRMIANVVEENESFPKSGQAHKRDKQYVPYVSLNRRPMLRIDPRGVNELSSDTHLIPHPHR